MTWNNATKHNGSWDTGELRTMSLKAGSAKTFSDYKYEKLHKISMTDREYNFSFNSL